MEMKPSLNLSMAGWIMTPRFNSAQTAPGPDQPQQILKLEIMQNPLLEEVDELTDNEDLAQENSPEEKANEEAEVPSEEDPIDWADYLQDGLDRTYVPQSEQSIEFLEKVPVTRSSLGDTLLEQLHFLSLPEDFMIVAEFLVGSLDDNGWLVTSVEDVAQAVGHSVEDVEKVIKVIQALEPAGIGARNLRECLLLQLEAKGLQDTLSFRIIHDHFDHLVNRRFPEIARQLKVGVEEVQAAADVIATLHPRPGLQVSSEDPRYVVPDLLVERVDEEYIVVLNDRHLPRLRISSAYESVLREKRKADGSDEQKTRDYIQGKINSARWLIQTIEQRRRTMIKVMNCIIREQREFFDKGIGFLRPLTLQQVARQIDMHESTVSRVCSGKYVIRGRSCSSSPPETGRLDPQDRRHQRTLEEEDKRLRRPAHRELRTRGASASRDGPWAKYREQLHPASRLPARGLARPRAGPSARLGDFQIHLTARHCEPDPRSVAAAPESCA
jgi:RNA polymerase sigma-54 factor